MVLIGLELMTSIEMYLKDNTIHAELMFLVALTAVARKVVILDAKTMEPDDRVLYRSTRYRIIRRLLLYQEIECTWRTLTRLS